MRECLISPSSFILLLSLDTPVLCVNKVGGCSSFLAEAVTILSEMGTKTPSEAEVMKRLRQKYQNNEMFLSYLDNKAGKIYEILVKHADKISFYDPEDKQTDLDDAMIR